MNLTFSNLSYTVRANIFTKEKKQLLSNIYGDFRPGELTAIIGPSGAGKSTLMDILAGFKSLNVTGSIQVNNHERDLKLFRRSSAYIMQNADLQRLLTVQEAMSVAAELKLNVSNAKKQEEISKILKELGLDKVGKTRTEKLSGSQQKRLAIALELLSNPPIMFLDEATSGLDSVSSYQCFELLQSMAHQGRTIICTIHQPSATLFNMIDHLYVLGNGRCVYSGSPAHSVSYLQSLELSCPAYHNPADYILELTSGEHGDHLKLLTRSSENGKNYRWRKSPTKFSSVLPQDDKHESSTKFAISTWGQIGALTKCNAIRLSRDRTLTYARFGTSLFVSLLTGMTCYGTGSDAAKVLYNFGLLSFIMEFLMFLSMNNAIAVFPSELPMLKREYFNRWYKLHSYYLANRIADMPIQLGSSSMYLIIEYFMTGQPIEFKRFILFLVSCILISLIAQMIGLFIGACFKIQTAALLGPITIVPTYIFSGFFVQQEHAHPALQWLFPLSFCYYGFGGVMNAIYGMDRPKLQCSEDYCHFSSPKVILNIFGAKNINYWISMSLLLTLYLFLNLVAYTALRIKLKTHSR